MVIYKKAFFSGEQEKVWVKCHGGREQERSKQRQNTAQFGKSR